MLPGSISVVIPVYRAGRALPELVDRLFAVLEPLDRPFELILVDDCSPDDSWAILERLREERGPRLKLVALARNEGQHRAILCGFSLTTGDIVVTMDDDLQHPPEEVPKLVAAIEAGHDLAIGRFEVKQHTEARNRSGAMIDRLLRRMFELPSDFALTSFRAADAALVRLANEMIGVYPYVTCMLLTNSATPTNVDVRHDPRPFGSSNYTLRRSFSLAFSLLFSYSSLPARAVALLGGISVAFAFLAAGGLAVLAVVDDTVPGWVSTLLALAVSNAISLSCLTIVAVYVGRVHRMLSGTRTHFPIRSRHD